MHAALSTLPLLVLQLATAERGIDPATEVAVVVNAADPESVAVGRYYCERRGIPPERILRLRTAIDEAIPRATFAEEVAAPVEAYLAANEAVRVLVPVWGVPVKVAEARKGDAPRGADAFTRHVKTVDAACVDRELELALLPGDHALDGWVENPVFGRSRHLTRGDRVVVVMRLDGPTPAAARALVDRALYAEAYGVEGTHLLDTRGLAAGDGYAQYDRELREVAPVFARFGLELRHDDEAALVDLSTLERAGHYWGWYTGRLQAAEPFAFAPGAVACHVHSFSAGTLRHRERNWVGPLVERGATVAVGTVYEPLTAGFPTAPLFWERFLAGYPAGEALQLANRFASWMAVYVGDPLYAPYAKGVRPAQVANRETAVAAHDALTELLDAGDLEGAGDWLERLEALPAPYAGARDAAALVREARARLAHPDRPARGTLAELRAALAEGEAAAARGDWDDARDAAEEALEASPVSFEANLLLGRALLRDGHGRRAVRPLELAVAVDPASRLARAALTRALLAAGREEEALESARRAADRALVGEALLALGRADTAIASLAEARRERPGERGVEVAYGRALLAAGRAGEAAAVFRAALDVLPEAPAGVEPYEVLLELWVEATDEADDDAAEDAARRVARAVGRLRLPSQRRLADLTGDADALAARDPTPLEAPPGRADPGPPRLRLASKLPEEATVYLIGPTVLELELPRLRRGEPPVAEAVVFPGVYRVVIALGSTREPSRVLTATLRAGLDRVVDLGLDPEGRWYEIPR